MPKNLDKNHWVETLDPYFPKLTEFTQEAFYKYQQVKEIFEETMVNMEISPKTAANLIHDAFESLAKQYFNGLPRESGLRAGMHNSVFGIYLRDKCFIRFNKLNDNFSISNAKTKQREKFENQITIAPFSNEVVYLNLGYKVDPFWSSIKSIHLVCWNSDFEWEYDLMDEASTLEQSRLDFDSFLYQGKEMAENANRVKPKKKRDTEEGDSGEKTGT